VNASTTQREGETVQRTAAAAKRKGKTIWRHFREDRPGERFENLHRWRRKERRGLRAGEKWVIIAAGVGLTLVGLVLVPAPGPGWLVVSLGLGLLGSEILSIARFLDASELKLREWASAARKAWKKRAS
jgi:hypothetical protein